jgi:hypothetical protein
MIFPRKYGVARTSPRFTWTLIIFPLSPEVMETVARRSATQKTDNTEKRAFIVSPHAPESA